MPDEIRLRQQAREAIQNGKLPTRAPDRTWGGPGVGVECSVCGRAVTKAELEFEIEFARNGVRCFAAWEFERNKAAQ
jgi:hypothetical protein